MSKLCNLYFAYGANTNIAEMALRCPGAELVGLAKLKGYRLAYRSGLLTLIKDDRFKTTCANWQIRPKHERSLDMYEGYPQLYGKEIVQAKTGLLKRDSGFVYRLTSRYDRSLSIPSTNYYTRCLQGYIDCGIDTEQLEMALYEVIKANKDKGAE